MTYHSLPPIVFGTALVAVMLLLATALGRRVLRLARVRLDGPAERFVFSAGLGFGLLQFVPFLLLAAGVARVTTIRIALAALLVLLAPDVWAILRAGWTRVRDAAGAQIAWWEWGALAAVALALLGVYARALCPPTDDDGLSYHLAAAVRLLHAHRFVYLPTLTYTNWPLGVESLYMVLLGLRPGAPVALVQFMLGALGVLAAYLLARRIGGPGAGRLAGACAAVFMLAYSVFWVEMAAAHVDVGTALFAGLAVYALWLSHCGLRIVDCGLADQRTTPYTLHPTPCFWLSTVFAGLAATTKLNGMWIIAAMALVGALTPGAMDGAAGLAARARRAAGYVAAAGAVALPWFLRTWAVTGNPLYPMFYSRLGGLEWTPAGTPRLQHFFLLYNTLPGLPHTTPYLLLSRGALVAAGALLAVAVYRATRGSALALPARFAVTFTPLLFLSTGYDLRYLMAIYPAVAVCAGVGSARWPRVAMAAAPVVGLLLAARLAFGIKAPNLPTAIAVAVGRTSYPAYLERAIDDYRVVEYANRTLPADARILVGTWEEHTAYYRPMAMRAGYWVQDSVHYDSQARLRADLARLGITYLVLKPMNMKWCPRSLVCEGRMEHETAALSQLARASGTTLYSANGVSLVRLNGQRPVVGSLGR